MVKDDFGNGRPPLDQVGVCFVPDVPRYELRKIRLLNTSHCSLVRLGPLAW
ncbi:hypothetical protein [Blastococcus sp. KM273128]|uniref:hypothetical protein n=1 Tax=Blastococcus sp. KM273128 TaxID=2570314 RepID=UPI001F40C3E0|nr:hypothetical protein [Blastococcus sp. KM273128]